MPKDITLIDAETLRTWLNENQPVNVLDVRPAEERLEWFIPGSVHMDIYNKLKMQDSTALDNIRLEKDVPIVTVCAGGRVSKIAAQFLEEKGYHVYSLDGGMKSWSLAWNMAKVRFDQFQIIQVRRTGKGCLSYIISEGKEAAIIDASLPETVYEKILTEEGLKLKYVIETHIHADHLSRSKELAALYDVSLYLPANDKVKFNFLPVIDGTRFEMGKIIMEAIATPGHTMESTSYIIDGKVILTGDTLFINSVGRPDLKADADEVTEKSRLLYRSLQKLLSLNDEVIVLPGHTSQPVEFDNKLIHETLGRIRTNIPLLKFNEEDFVKRVSERIPATPENYLSIVEKNISGDFKNINPADLEAGANRCAIA